MPTCNLNLAITMSYMQSGCAGHWASHEFEFEANSQFRTLHFYDWEEFEDKFCRAFTPLNAEATAINILEMMGYFQGRCSVNEYLNHF